MAGGGAELSPLAPSGIARRPHLNHVPKGVGCLLAAVMFTGCGDVLVPGTTLGGELAGRERRGFRVALRQGDAVRVFVDQRQTDLVHGDAAQEIPRTRSTCVNGASSRRR